jgi:hypothetical protein
VKVEYRPPTLATVARQRGGHVAHRSDERLRRRARRVGGTRDREDRAVERSLGDAPQGEP